MLTGYRTANPASHSFPLITFRFDGELGELVAIIRHAVQPG